MQSLSAVEAQLTKQFRSEFESKYKSLYNGQRRTIEAVHISNFDRRPSGAESCNFMELGIEWDSAGTLSAEVALIPLGDGLFGVTFHDGVTHMGLPAVISFR